MSEFQSGVTAQDKYKTLKDGTVAKYIYYGCTRSKDIHCKGGYLEEKVLLAQLLEIIEKLDLDKTGMRRQLETEIERHKEFNARILGRKDDYRAKDVDIRNYAKYILENGTVFEKRSLLDCLKTKIILKNKTIST